MSKHKRAETAPTPDAPDTGQVAEEAPAQSAPEESASDLQQELVQARARIEELTGLRLREAAEFENYKTRRLAEQERQEKMALRSLMGELIEVDSNFRHALSGAEGDLEAYKKGVEMIAGQFANILERNGVTRIEALGQPFDHNLHEALLQVEEGDHEGLKVTAVLKEGYLMHDQVLRQAGVKVARGSAAVTETAPAE